jgi:hypothetical protein
MSYTITKTNGTTLGTILDGTINTTTTSLTLIGRNYANYGQIVVNDLVGLLENFAYSSSPDNPIVGQLWWDTTNNVLKVYSANPTTTIPFWKIVGGATAQGSAPSTVIAGDFWLNTATQQLYIYNGTTPYEEAGWILVGPQRNNSGAIWEQISDGITFHDVVSIKLDGVRTAIISEDTFVPNIVIPGITQITSGWNMSSAYTIYGTANVASYLGSQPAANYFRNNINNSGTGTLSIVNNSGITVGSNGQLTLNTSGNTVNITNNMTNGNINLSNENTNWLVVNGVANTIEVASDPTTALGIATKGYVDLQFTNTALLGIPTAATAPGGTSTTQLATTEFVVSGLSGLFPYKIYQNNSHMWINDTGVGAANLVIDGTTVMTASEAGMNLYNGATAITQTQVYNDTGNARVATTQFVKTAQTWWGNASHRSAKWVSTSEPIPGTNDVGSNDGDFWFQIES